MGPKKMILRAALNSPFSRKVEIAARMLGLIDRIEIVYPDMKDNGDPLWNDNPLGTVPVLVLEDGTPVFGSPVILDYLDTLSADKKLIPNGRDRFVALRMQALADGLLDAAALQVAERRFRPREHRSTDWLAFQAKKVNRTLAALETDTTLMDIKRVTIGHLAVACALSYLDLHFERSWRASHPNLVSFLDSFAAEFSFAASKAAA